MFRGRMLKRLEQMLESAIRGDFQETDYDETRLSRLESKWKQFLGASQLSRKNLEQEKENIKSLLSDISHQTKTPIANMKLYVTLLQEGLEKQNQEGGWQGTDSDRQQQNVSLLREIEKQTEKLDFLIQSLTKMSRLESNIVEVRPRTQEVSPLVKEAVKNIQPKAEKKKIQITLSLQPGVTACFDQKWTREALENVLDNAIKYSGCESEIAVSVRGYEMYTAISVRDRGIGISEQDIPKIFERFYRATEVQQEDGVGIGLFLTREILRKQNGYIKVRSKKGRGSEFSLYLWRRLS